MLKYRYKYRYKYIGRKPSISCFFVLLSVLSFFLLIIILKARFEIPLFCAAFALIQEGLEIIFDKSVPKFHNLVGFIWVELCPYFDSVVEFEGIVWTMGNKSQTVDLFGTSLGFAQEVQNQPFIDFLVSVIIFFDLET